MPFLLVLLFCGLAYSQDFFQFELEEREQPADTLQEGSSGWLIEDGSSDTLEYFAIDLEYDVFSKTFNLNNKAQLKYRTATLNGDTIVYSQRDKTIEVIGNPVFRETSQPSLASYKMRYNLSTKIGEIVYGTSYMDNQQFNGTVIRAVTIQNADTLKEQRFLIERGDFSTCSNPEHQHYSFFSRRMALKPKESVTARPVVLNMGEVPVAILPMMISPMKSGRRSGLLTPRFGGDQAQGFFMRNIGYYYAPSDYWDAQLYADILEGSTADFTKSSVNGEVRYTKRYVLDGYVNATGYWNNGTIWRDYDIRFKHSQNITPDRSKTLNGEGSFVSRQDLRQQNGIDEQTVLNQQANADMTYYQKIDDSRNMTVKTRQEYNLQTGFLTRQIPDVRYNSSGPLFEPSLSGENIKPPFWEKINYSHTGQFNHYLERKPTPDTTFIADSLRIDTLFKDTTHLGLSDRLSFNFTETFFNILNVTPSVNFSGNWTAREYNLPDSINDRSNHFAFEPSKNDYGQIFLKYDLSTQVGTKLYGIWLPEWGRFTGVRHTLSPTVGYTYAPELDTNYRFFPHPLLGQSTFQSKQKTVNFRLGNDFDMKYLLPGADEAGEDADPDDYSKNLRILTSTHSSSYNFAADSFQFSPISSSFGIQVFENYLFTINTTHDVYHRFEDDYKKVRFPQLTNWSYGFSRRFSWGGDFNAGLPSKEKTYESKLWNAGVDYNYSFSSSRVSRDLFRDDYRHTLFLSAALYPSRKWNVQYSSQYSFEEGQFTSHSLQFYRELHCWKMDFTWRPAGAAPGWSFSIYVLDLPDVRLSASNTEDSYGSGY
jgi:lipopolysaccharide assembly outer membrane protein LptD (OstA)